MKKMKKLLALVIAMAMVLAMSTSAFAAPGDATSDTTISVTDLTAGDSVTYYQVIEWVENTGWAFKAPFTSLSAADLEEIVGTPSVPASVDPATGDPIPAVPAKPGKITQAMADKIAALASGGTTETLSGTTTWSKNNPAPGLYMVVPTSKTTGVVYNPAFVAADYKEGGTNTISITATYSDTAVAKKTTFTTFKTVKEHEDAIKKAKASLVGDIVSFDVDTTVPVFLDSYTNPTFKLEDEVSAGMELVVDDTHPITVVYGSTTVKNPGDANVTITKDTDTKYTVDFDSDYLKANATPVTVKITYFAKVTSAATFNVNWMKNEVKVTYSNGPDEAKGVEKDVTNHYTFSIGAEIKGKQGKKGYEAVKVGVDSEGKELTELTEVTLDDGKTARSLAGALFGLYTSEDAAKDGLLPTDANNGLVVNDNYPDGATFTTLDDGIITFTGLDAGNYFLKELDAPAGFIKDTAVHPVVIAAEYEQKEYTETVDGMEVKYTTSILKSYTVTIDGKTTTYTFDNTGETLVDPKVKDVTTEEDRIGNTKGVELPSTGGMGTTIFYIVGAALVIGAGVILVTRRRMDAK